MEYAYSSHPMGIKYQCRGINPDIGDYETIVSQSINASCIEEARDIFNEFLGRHFEDAQKPWNVTIDEYPQDKPRKTMACA